jgi:hypothetical protein
MSVLAAIILAQTESKAFAPFIPVIAAIVGGMLTAGGGVAANVFQLSTTRKMERRQFYRERLEQIYLWVNQVIVWMQSEEELWDMRPKMPEPAFIALRAQNPENPISRLRLSVDFYFPELAPEVVSMGECIESFSASLENRDSPEARHTYHQRAQDIRTSFIDSLKPLVARYK